MRKNAIIRIRIITGVVLFLALVLLGRLYHIQIVNHETYNQLGEQQYVHTVSDLYSRGSIYFTTKDGEKVSAATIKTGYLLSIDPTRIKDVDKTYEAINSVVEIDKDTVTKRHDWNSDYPHYIGSPKMNSIGKYLAKNLNVHLNSHVAKIEEKQNKLFCTI